MGVVSDQIVQDAGHGNAARNHDTTAKNTTSRIFRLQNHAAQHKKIQGMATNVWATIQN